MRKSDESLPIFVALSLFALALSAAAPVPGLVAPRYTTSCVVVDATSADGYLRNDGEALVKINGLVKFNFPQPGSMSRPSVQIPSAAIIPPGQAVKIAELRLGALFLPGGTCLLDVSEAIR